MAGTKEKATNRAAGQAAGWWHLKFVALLFLGWVVVCGAVVGVAGEPERFATNISSLIDPVKLVCCITSRFINISLLCQYLARPAQLVQNHLAFGAPLIPLGFEVSVRQVFPNRGY